MGSITNPINPPGSAVHAFVKNGVVESIFTTDKGVAEFPDIAQFLVLADASVQCGYTYDGIKFSAPRAPIKNYSSSSFIGLFTADERKQIILLFPTNVDVADWYYQILASENIKQDDKELATAMDNLVSLGALDQLRRDEILS